MKKLLSQIQLRHLFVGGLIVLLVSLLPTLLLGTDSIVPYHDQLDGEIIAYIYQAKYLFSEQNVIPEFLNGADKAALTPPAPLAVLLFCIFPPFVAYTIMQIIGQFTAYIGTFLLVNTFSNNKYITFIVSLLFAFLPFLPVYGLSQYGVPLLLFCFWNLYNRKHILPSIIYVAFFTGMSSFVLCGFFPVAIGLIITLLFGISGQLKKQMPLISAFALMLGIYILENLTLFSQILGFNATYISHKEDYVLTTAPLLTQFSTYFTSSTEHVTDNHKWIIYVIVGTMVIFFLTYKSASTESKQLCKWLTADVLLICIFCIAAAFWDTSFIITLRESMGALKSFQFTRILWFTPILWYVALALCLMLLWSNKSKIKCIPYLFSILMMGIIVFTGIKYSLVKPCIQTLLSSNYQTISWSDYYALGVMDQVEDFIYEQDSLSINEYKVASLGIDPAAALYHGFYCIDGYSNNYDIEYKQAFREVIAPELAKSEWLTAYYDDWGNRCYLMASENSGYYTIEKATFWYNNLQLNTDALKQLGCDYILSAAYIVTAEDMNLTLMREEAFETESSYYRIFIYKIN